MKPDATERRTPPRATRTTVRRVRVRGFRKDLVVSLDPDGTMSIRELGRRADSVHVVSVGSIYQRAVEVAARAKGEDR